MSFPIHLPPRFARFCRSWYMLILTVVVICATLKVLAASQSFSDAGLVLSGPQCASLDIPVTSSGTCDVHASLRATWNGQWLATPKLPGRPAPFLLPTGAPIAYFSGASSRIPFWLMVAPVCAIIFLSGLSLLDSPDKDTEVDNGHR